MYTEDHVKLLIELAFLRGKEAAKEELLASYDKLIGLTDRTGRTATSMFPTGLMPDYKSDLN